MRKQFQGELDQLRKPGHCPWDEKLNYFNHENWNLTQRDTS